MDAPIYLAGTYISTDYQGLIRGHYYEFAVIEGEGGLHCKFSSPDLTITYYAIIDFLEEWTDIHQIERKLPKEGHQPTLPFKEENTCEICGRIALHNHLYCSFCTEKYDLYD